jgi:hypothetical protein
VKRRLVAACAVAAAVMAIGCGGGEDLSYRWPAGQDVVQRHTFESSGGTVMGSSGRLRTEMTVRKTVLQSSPEGARLRMRMERIVAEVEPAGTPPFRFDTQNPPPSEEGAPAYGRRMAVLGLLVGEEFEARCTSTGDIAAFDGLDGVAGRVRSRLPEGDPRAESMTQFLQPASLRYQVAPLVRVPLELKPVGSEWPYNEIRLLPAESTGIRAFLYCKGTGKLVSAKDGRTRVEIQGRVVLDPPDGAPALPEPLRVTRALLRLEEGAFKGYAIFDSAKGELLEAEHRVELKLVFVKEGSTETIRLDPVIVHRIEPVK